jgi:hypothetical protein
MHCQIHSQGRSESVRHSDTAAPAAPPVTRACFADCCGSLRHLSGHHCGVPVWQSPFIRLGNLGLS